MFPVFAERGLILEVIGEIEVAPERFVSGTVLRVHNYPVHAGGILLGSGKPHTDAYMVIASLCLRQTCQFIVGLLRVGSKVPELSFLLRYVHDGVRPFHMDGTGFHS